MQPAPTLRERGEIDVEALDLVAQLGLADRGLERLAARVEKGDCRHALALFSRLERIRGELGEKLASRRRAKALARPKPIPGRMRGANPVATRLGSAKGPKERAARIRTRPDPVVDSAFDASVAKLGVLAERARAVQVASRRHRTGPRQPLREIDTTRPSMALAQGKAAAVRSAFMNPLLEPQLSRGELRLRSQTSKPRR